MLNIEISKKLKYGIIIIMVLLILYIICQIRKPEQIILANVRKYIENQEKLDEEGNVMILKSAIGGKQEVIIISQYL